MFSLFSCSGGRLSFPKVEINPPSLSLSLSLPLFQWVDIFGLFMSAVCLCEPLCSVCFHLSSRRDIGVATQTSRPRRSARSSDTSNLLINITEKYPEKFPQSILQRYFCIDDISFSKGKSLNRRLWLQTFYSLNKNSFKLISFFKKMLSRPSTGFHLKRVSIRS